MIGTHDHPFHEVAAGMETQAAKGMTCFQKFTCAACGQRLTMDVPNVMYTKGGCDRCGHVTDIEAQGCNYVLFAPIGQEARHALDVVLDSTSTDS